jgi:hypothetical protein
MKTNLENAAFHMELDSLTSAIDRAIESAGDRPAGYPKIVAKYDGFALVDVHITLGGRWSEQQICWNRLKSACEASAKRRA